MQVLLQSATKEECSNHNHCQLTVIKDLYVELIGTNSNEKKKQT